MARYATTEDIHQCNICEAKFTEREIVVKDDTYYLCPSCGYGVGGIITLMELRKYLEVKRDAYSPA